jgi:hypothetical protein
MIWIIAYLIVGIIAATIVAYGHRREGHTDKIREIAVAIFFWPLVLLLVIPRAIGEAIADRQNNKERPTNDEIGPNDY